MIQLSKRLYAISNLITPTKKAADIGTDHAYLPIFLVQQQICNQVIAMDVHEGPLSIALNHIQSYNLGQSITIRLSNGLQALQPLEVDCIVIAGMGGNLIIRILEDGFEIAKTTKQILLQPQSMIEELRYYLVEKGYTFLDEDFVEEDGKYYPIMKVVWNSNSSKTNAGSTKSGTAIHPNTEKNKYTTVEYRYGPLLLKNHNATLLAFLIKEKKHKESIVRRLLQTHGSTFARVKELQEEIQVIEEGLAYDST